MEDVTVVIQEAMLEVDRKRLPLEFIGSENYEFIKNIGQGMCGSVCKARHIL